MLPFRVLVVDDNPYALQTVQTALAGTDYVVETATTGAEGLQKAAALPPDVVLLDLVMPGMSGIEVVHRLRESPVHAEVSIVVVTSLDDRATRLDALGAGADEFLGKPINIPELRARLRTLAKVNRYRRLSDERARLAWLAEGSEDGILLLRPDGTTAWTNRAARRLLGIAAPPADAGLRFLERARELYSLSPEEAFAGWPGAGVEKVERHLVRPASRSAPPLWLRVDLLGGSDGASVCLRDVTASVTSFRDSWTVGQVLGHKLRTPLNGIIGALDAISEGKETIDRTELHDWTGMMAEQVERLRRHVLDLTGFVQRSAHPEVEEPSPASELPEIVRRAAEMAGIGGPVDVVVEDAPSEETLLPLSAGHLEPILFELFRNSVRAHPKGKPGIQVRLRRAEAGLVCLEVLDDGVNVPPEALGSLCRPFYQLEALPTGELPGTGLGLTWISLVVAEAGGVVRIANRDDRPGMRVEIRVPQAVPAS